MKGTLRIVMLIIVFGCWLQGGALFAQFCSWPDSCRQLPPRLYPQYDTVRENIRPMGLVGYHTSAVVHTARMASESTPEQISSNAAVGISGKLQLSALWAYRASRPERRFSWGDILAAQYFLGGLSTSLPHESGKVWAGYRFEFGFGARYRVNPHNDIGLNMILLTFARDNVSGNLSGSEISGRFRHRHILVEAGAVARHDRVLGVFTNIGNKTPMMGKFSVCYLMPEGQFIGVQAEYLSGAFHQDGRQYTNIGSFSIQYGFSL